ncbi:signal peptidase II [[Collinsella] massiliensis]|uniref:signal peptidase II n=1 Tax=[Collinsella] massiliensis TaxID=1232426 RepID=UPI001F13D946|nr:signal peptidase II [[Collinsella] massiliensis]
MAARTDTTGTRHFQPSLAWRLGVLGALAAAFVIADQVSKALVRATQAQGGFPVEVLPGVVGFEYVENRGAAFGLGEGFGFVFVLLAVVMVAASVVYLVRAPRVSRLEVVGLGMVCGGAIGNAIDRVALGYVTDFITTRFMSFPSLNIADIGVTVGVVIALIGFIFLSPANEKERSDGR